jgi:hypothetical protein
LFALENLLLCCFHHRPVAVFELIWCSISPVVLGDVTKTLHSFLMNQTPVYVLASGRSVFHSSKHNELWFVFRPFLSSCRI